VRNIDIAKVFSDIADLLDINSIDYLESAILDGRVADLPRMGDKVAENILHQIQAMRVADGAKRSIY
jgi:DNA polymerase (family 10)